MEEAHAPSHEPPTSHEGTKPVSPLQETSLDEEASYYEDEEEYEYDEDEEEGEEFDDAQEDADEHHISRSGDQSNHHHRDSNNDDDHANDGSRPPVLRASTFCDAPESVAPTVTVSSAPALLPTPSHTVAPAADNDQRGNGHTNRRRSSETGGDSSVVESPRTRQPSRVAVHDHDHATSNRGNNGVGDGDDGQDRDPFSQESPPLPPTDQERLDYFSLTFERMQRVVACGAEFVETAMRDGGALDGTVPAAVPMPRNHRTGTTHGVGGGVRGGVAGGGGGAASSGAPIPSVFKATSSPPSVSVPTPKSAGAGAGPRPLSGGPERKTSGGDLRAKQQLQLNADLSFEWERDAIRAAAAAALPFNHGQMRAHSPRPGHKSHGSVQPPPATHAHQHPPQQNAETHTGTPGVGVGVGGRAGVATSVGSRKTDQSTTGTGVVGPGQQRPRPGIPTIDSEDTRPQSANGHGTGRPMSSGGPSAAVASDVAGSIETPLSGPRSAAEACAYCALDVANALGDIVEAITDRTSRPPLEANSSPDEDPVNGKSSAAGRGGENAGDQGLLTQTSTLSPAAVAAKTSAIPSTANAQQGRGNKRGKQNDDDGEAVLEQAEEWLAHQDQMRGAHGECDRLVLASASVIQGLIGLVVSGKRKIATQAATLSFLAQQPASVQGTAADVTMSLGSVSAGAGALAAIGGLPGHTFITDTASANAAEGSSGRVGSPHHRPGSPYSRPLSPTQAALSARGGSGGVEPPRALSPTAMQRPAALDEMDMSGMMSARSYQGAGLEALGGFVGGGPVYASAEQVEAYRRHVQVRNVLAASAAPIAQTQQYSVRIEPTQGMHAPAHHLPHNRSQQDTNDGQVGSNEFGDDSAALNPGEYVGRALSPRHARPGTAGEGQQRRAKGGMAQRPTSPLTRPASRLDQAKLGTSVIQPGSASRWRNADEPSEKQRRAEAVIAALEPRPGSALAKKLSEQASGQASAGAAQMGVALGDAPYGHTQVRPATVTAAVDREVSKLHQALDCTKSSQFECDWRDLEGDTTVTDRRNALKGAKNADKILLKHLDKDRRDYVMFKGLMRRREDFQAPGLRSAKDLAGRMSDIVSSTASQYGSSQLVFSYSDEQNNPNPSSAKSTNPDQTKSGDKSASGVGSGKNNAGRRPKSGTPSVGAQEQSGALQTADAASYQNYMRNVAAGIFVGGGGGLGDGDAPFLGTLGTGGLIEEMDEFKKSQTAHGRAVATTLPPPSTSPKWRTSSDPRPPEWKRHSRHAAGPLVDKARSRPGSSAATRGGRPASRSARELPDLSENDVSVMGVIATLKDSVRSGSGGRSKAQNTRTLGRVPSAGSTRGGGGGGLADASFVSSSGIGGLSGVGTGVVTSTPASVPSTEKPQRELSSVSGISQELAQLRDLSAVSVLSTPNDESGTGARNGNGNNSGAIPNPKRTTSSAGTRRSGGEFSGGSGGGGLPPTGQGRPNTAATRATAPNVGGGGRAHGASFSEGSSAGGGGPGRAKSFKDFVEAQRRSATPQPSTAELAGDIASGRTVTMVIGSVRR